MDKWNLDSALMSKKKNKKKYELKCSEFSVICCFCFATIRDQRLKMIKTQKNWQIYSKPIKNSNAIRLLKTLKNYQINWVNSSFLPRQLQVGVCLLAAFFDVCVLLKEVSASVVWWVTGSRQLMAFEWNTVACTRYLFLQPLLFVLKKQTKCLEI